MGEKKRWKTLAEAREEKNEGGLVCPMCGCRRFDVARTVRGDGVVRRHRVCGHCGKKILTVETTI